jgi:hypothetical protein
MAILSGLDPIAAFACSVAERWDGVLRWFNSRGVDWSARGDLFVGPSRKASRSRLPNPRQMSAQMLLLRAVFGAIGTAWGGGSRLEGLQRPAARPYRCRRRDRVRHVVERHLYRPVQAISGQYHPSGVGGKPAVHAANKRFPQWHCPARDARRGRTCPGRSQRRPDLQRLHRDRPIPSSRYKLDRCLHLGQLVVCLFPTIDRTNPATIGLAWLRQCFLVQ